MNERDVCAMNERDMCAMNERDLCAMNERDLCAMNERDVCAMNERDLKLMCKEIKSGCGSSIGGMSAWHASGPKFDPHDRHILSWRLGHEKFFIRPFSLFR